VTLQLSPVLHLHDISLLSFSSSGFSSLINGEGSTIEVENHQRMEAMTQQRLCFIRRPLLSFTADEINDLATDELRLVCTVHLIAVLVSELEYLGFVVYKRNSKLRRALKRECGILPPPAETPSSSGGVLSTSLPLANAKDSSSNNAHNIHILEESFALLYQGSASTPSDVSLAQVPPPAYWIGLGRPPPAPNWIEVDSNLPTPSLTALGRPPPAPNWHLLPHPLSLIPPPLQHQLFLRRVKRIGVITFMSELNVLGLATFYSQSSVLGIL
jgi:hypothetical protein